MLLMKLIRGVRRNGKRERRENEERPRRGRHTSGRGNIKRRASGRMGNEGV